MFLEKVSKLLLISICVYFAYILITDNHHWSPIDYANLGLHEAGHLVFMPFGRFIYMLGGSLTQIAIPILFCIYFFKEKDYFASSTMIFWVGNNMLNVGVYMSDAIHMQLPLFGGEGTVHDWNYLFTQMSVLDKSELIGSIMFNMGAVGMIFGICTMIFFAFTNKKTSNI